MTFEHSLPPQPPWAEVDAPQADQYGDFLQLMGGQWTYLSASTGDIGDFSIGRYSALLTPERAAEALDGLSWDVQKGSGSPGFSTYYDGDNEVTTYQRRRDDGIELLVYYRTFHGVRPSDLELAEEFRLLFNLWEDRSKRTYYYFDDAGNPVRAAVVERDSVRALTRLVRRYQAAKQMHLALYHDSTRFSTELTADGYSWQEQTADTVIGYNRAQPSLAGAAGKPFSRLLGKMLFAPPPSEESGFWPYRESEPCESFIIGIDRNGREVVYSSDPDGLANYFGANPEAPHYLTPVYFRKEVLNKYYANPSLYSVEDGYLRCAGLWGLRLDNDLKDHVMVFLGDLGRDLAYSEARYWRSFNVDPPDEGPSKTLIKRAFLAQFADAESVDFRFATAYHETNETWERAFGWPLFKELHEDDTHVKANLHIPITNSQAEFDEQVLYVAKLIVDSINEEAIVAEIGHGPKAEGGLAKLQRFLETRGVTNARSLLRPFANVQGLRSRGAAHRKGSEFDLAVALGDLGRREGFERLLSEAITAFDALSGQAKQAEHEHSRPSAGPA
jgi:hypothetical protein